ncbi:bestrophin family protein [Frigidibacter sp. MR17.24]|uniref:bestrophin family protein n=1 Tax=Frigidibacter sp. MR17.24 TaxID=3127345 RepID=UPI003012C1EF
MIIRPRPGVLTLFFVLRHSVIRKVWPMVLGVGLISSLIVTLHRTAPEWVPAVNPTPFSLLGIALSIFLGFRNSAAYDRWWEARKLLGAMVIGVREVGRATHVLADPGLRDWMLLHLVAWIRLVEHQLRGTEGPVALPVPMPDRPIAQRNPAEAMLQEIGARLATEAREGRLGEVSWVRLDEGLGLLMKAQAACERIKATPVPFGYALLLHRTAHPYCFLLPFGFADLIGWLTPILSLLVAYAFFGLDALADEVEQPFGLEPNDLPLAAIARNIEIELQAARGIAELPEPLAAVDGLLH